MEPGRDHLEQNQLLDRLPTLSFTQTRRLYTLYHKYRMDLMLLCFNFPPRAATDVEMAQMDRLRDAVSEGPITGYLSNIQLTAYSELLDECRLRLKLYDEVHAPRTRRYTFLMKKRYLDHIIKGEEEKAEAMKQPGYIRAQQTAICAVIFRASIFQNNNTISNRRILAVVDMVKYVNLQQTDDKDCSICYGELQREIPVIQENNIQMGEYDPELGHIPLVCNGTIPSDTHCAAELPCGHKFGAKCIWKWVLRRNMCPLCRNDCTNDLNKYEETDESDDEQIELNEESEEDEEDQ